MNRLTIITACAILSTAALLYLVISPIVAQQKAERIAAIEREQREALTRYLVVAAAKAAEEDAAALRRAVTVEEIDAYAESHKAMAEEIRRCDEAARFDHKTCAVMAKVHFAKW